MLEPCLTDCHNQQPHGHSSICTGDRSTERPVAMDAPVHKMSLCFLMDAPLPRLSPTAPVTPPMQVPSTTRPVALPGSFSPVTTDSKAIAPKRVRKRKLAAAGSKKPRKSRVIYDFPLETLAQYFHFSQRDAAKELGVSAITIKRNCKRLGIMWPFRANKQQETYSTRERVEPRSSIETESERDDRDDEGEEEENDDEGEDEYMCNVDPSRRAAAVAVRSQPSLPSPAVPQADTRLMFFRLPYLHLTKETSL